MNWNDLLLGLGIFLVVGSHLWWLNLNMRRSVWLGIATLLIPPLALAALFQQWGKAWYGLAMIGAGMLLFFLDSLLLHGAFRH